VKKWKEVFLQDKRIWLALAAAFLLGLSVFSTEDGMTQTEKRVARALSLVSGAGEVEVVIHYAQSASAFSSNAQQPVGAMAVCEGAGDIAVRMNVTEALRTLLGLEVSQVMVLKMEELP